MAKPFEPPRAFRLRRRTNWLIPAVASIQTLAQGVASAGHKEWFDTVLWTAATSLLVLFVTKLENLKVNPGGWAP